MDIKFRLPETITIKRKTLKEIISQHLTWLESEGKGGVFMNLHNANLFQADLSGANLQKANLIGCNLQGAKLNGANLSYANLSGTDLSGAKLVNTILSGTNLSGAKLNDSNITGARLNLANLCEADLSGAWMKWANLEEAQLPSTKMVNTNLTEADLAKADLSKVNLFAANLDGANLTEVNLYFADLYQASLVGADLNAANLYGANFTKSRLNGANLGHANLNEAICIETDFTNATLDHSKVYGISAWNLKMEGAKQSNIIITKSDEPVITVDDIEVAQFIYLILNNKKIRDVLDTITSKVVLILGRFTPERKIVLDALREELRKNDYTPIIFDFDKPANKNITETVSTLAHLARFVIADITDAKSIPQELQRIVPDLPSLAVQPIILDSQYEYGMFKDFLDYPWVLLPHRYSSLEDLLASLTEKVVGPALDKSREIEMRRRQIEEELSKR